MNRSTFRLVLLVSFAHAMVHIFELALPSMEQLIGEEYRVGKDVTGWLGTVWRFPFGIGALLAGWLADRYGSKPLLVIYLAGCAATSVAAWAAGSMQVLFATMFLMGCFASIYHPAGLALISRETTPANRGAALGWHGIFGSLGIGGAPFLAAVAFSSSSISWRQFYLFLAIPGGVLALVLVTMLVEHHRKPAKHDAPTDRGEQPEVESEEGTSWPAFFLLVAAGALTGVIYAAFVHFLPRYLDDAWGTATNLRPESLRNYWASLAMLCALVGQALAGRIARPGRMEWQLSGVMFAAVPALTWVAFAEGRFKIAAVCMVAFVHFMSQPIYNSLIAQYVPRARRSLGYGFSNMVAFGIGALGPAFAGVVHSDRVIYGSLAAVALGAGLLSFLLACRRNPGRPDAV
ncbi:MAG: MFS transporter [Planctomycetaceae bacterium]